MDTLDSGINVSPRKFGKNIISVALKIGILIPSNRGYFEKKICITLSNKEHSPWKKNPKINKHTPMFIPESGVFTFLSLHQIL